MSPDPRAREEAVVRQLRETYESQGFAFFEHPQRDLVPPFFGSYRPDAIALRPDKKVAIEIKTHRRASERQLTKISGLFQGRKDWELKVVFAESASQPQVLAPASSSELTEAIRDARQIAAGGHLRAATLMSWALLEACARNLAPEVLAMASDARSVIQWLTAEGHIDQRTAASLRDLVPLRDAVVHGDLSRSVSQTTVDTVLDTAAALLSGEPSHGPETLLPR